MGHLEALGGFIEALDVLGRIAPGLRGDQQPLLGPDGAMPVCSQLEPLAPGVLASRVVLDARDVPQAQA